MHGHFRRVALTACFLFGALPAPAAHAEYFCVSPHQCRQPDSMNVLLRPGGTEVVLDANFGLVYPSPAGDWQYTCDDVFGGRVPYRTQIARDGRVYVPAMDGLWVGSAGCGWTKAEGALAGQAVYDVTFDPTDPQRVWIVGGDPRMVALSTNGGMTFTARQTFPPQLLFIRVAVAPSDPKIVYVAGFNGTKAPLVMGVSTDGGVTWTLDENASMGVAGSNQIVDFLGVSPDDPHTVYVMVTSGKGDEIWKSTSNGRALTKVLTLADDEEWPRGGFAFGANGKTVYVAGYDPLNTGMQPPASLYISHDGGGVWERRPGTAAGPRYRSLGYRDGKLYACGGDQIVGDQFFLGVSSDEGRSWSSLVQLTNIGGPNSCVSARCAATVDFLLPFRAGPDAGAGADAGALPDAARPLPEPPAPHLKSGGCSYAAATGPGGPVALLGLLVSLVLVLRRGRGRSTR
jgi:hypothetical protein